jgi:hypothetical protein
MKINTAYSQSERDVSKNPGTQFPQSHAQQKVPVCII